MFERHAAADVVLLAGGDGSFMAGLTALARTRSALPVLGPLPFGTVATVARNFGARGAPLGLAAKWLSLPTAILRERAQPRSSLGVTAHANGSEPIRRVGFIFGTGLVARFFEQYEARGAGGLPLAARIVARIFAESFTGGPLAKRVLTPMPLTIAIDDDPPVFRGFSLLTTAVVRDLGLGMKVTYKAGAEPGRLHLVASSLGPSSLGPRMPFVLAGRSIGGASHVDRLVRHFTLTHDEPIPHVLDGDMFYAERIVVEPGPAIRVLTA